jgi:hypothetical protein
MNLIRSPLHLIHPRVGFAILTNRKKKSKKQVNSQKSAPYEN